MIDPEELDNETNIFAGRMVWVEKGLQKVKAPNKEDIKYAVKRRNIQSLP